MCTVNDSSSMTRRASTLGKDTPEVVMGAVMQNKYIYTLGVVVGGGSGRRTRPGWE